ncbi:aldehyde dehydrogenase family protein [Streptomyces canus]|nr:aldehyde dehydrogenase family protein [Streptomyces canus]
MLRIHGAGEHPGTFRRWLQTSSDEEEAARLANDTRFGLAATVATGDPERVRDLQAPLGGCRDRPSGQFEALLRQPRERR